MEAIRELAIPKAWFRGFTELELEAVMPEWMAGAPFDNFILLSDDTVPTKKALDCVEEGLTRHEVFTGWCNISPNRPDVTVSHKRLSIPGDHAWENVQKVGRLEGEFTTTFACFALTGARKAIWQRFPFQTYTSRREAHGPLVHEGWGSDFSFSRRLQDAEIPIYSHRDAFVYHLASRENFIVGKAPGYITCEGVPIA